jgi:hypothetical protein
VRWKAVECSRDFGTIGPGAVGIGIFLGSRREETY